MPYFTKKGTGKDKGKTCVHKKSSKKKVGCTDGPIEKYLTALRMAESSDMDWMKGPISFTFGEIKHNIHNYVFTGDTIYLSGNLQLDEDDDWERLELKNEPGIVKSVRGEGTSRRVDVLFGENITNLPLWYNSLGHDNLDLGTLVSDDDIVITIPNKNINESNELDWVKDLDTYYKVEQLEVGKTYEFVPDYSIMDNEGFDDIPNWLNRYEGQKFYIIKKEPKDRWPSLSNITFKTIGLSNKMVYDGNYTTLPYTARVFLWGKFKEVENPEFVMESNSLDWIENTAPKFTAELLELGQKFYDKWGDVTRVLEYMGKDEENICYEPPCTLLKFRKIKDPSGHHPYQSVPADDPLNTDMIFIPSEFDRDIDMGKLTPIFGDLNESDESYEDPLKWIKDVKTNQDIAQELYDGLVWHKEDDTVFVTPQWNGHRFSVRPSKYGRDKIIINPSSFHVNYRKYMIETLGIWRMEDGREIYFSLRKLIAQKIHNNLNESDELDWIKDTVNTKLTKNENWILVNDIDRESIAEGHEIQKYLFDLGYSWGSGDFQSLKDFCIYTIYHFGNEKNDNQIYYQDGCRDAEVRMSDKDIKGGRYMIYYWSDLKPKTIKEENELDWVKDVKPKGFEKSKSYVVDVSDLKPYTSMSTSPTSEEYTKLTRADVLNNLKWLGYNIDDIPVDEADYLYIEPNDKAGYWDDSVWVSETHWVDYDMEHTTPDPTYNGKYEMIDVDEFMFLVDNNLISESTDFDWVKDIPLIMNTCEAYGILKVGDEIIIDEIDNWEDNPNQWDTNYDVQTFYNVKAKVLALDECSNIHRNNESNARTILVSIEENGYYGFDDLWADDFVGTLPSQCQRDNCMFLICESSEPEYQIQITKQSLNESDDFKWIQDIEPSWLKIGQKFTNINNVRISRRYEPKDKVQVGGMTFEIYDINHKHGEPHLRFTHNDVMDGRNWELKKEKEISQNYGGTKFTQAKHNIDTGFWIPLTDCEFITPPILVGKTKPDGSPYGYTYCKPDMSHGGSLHESNDFDWVDEIPKDYYPPDLESGLKDLEKWVGQAYQTDDEIGLSVQDVKENPSKENIQDLINVLKHWKPYHDGDEVYWAVEDLISSINPFRFRDLNNMGLFESDLGWINDTSNKIQTTGIGHDGNIISLQKVYFDFLRIIAKVENNYNPTYESQATLDTKYTRKVKDYLNLNSRDYQGLARELLHIGLDEAFKMYFDNNPQLSESDELNWVEGTGLGKVDLRDCKPGDILITRNGRTAEYVGPSDGHYDHEIKFEKDSYGTRTHDGYVFRNNRRDDDEDIIHVLKEHKKTITEAAGISFEARKWGEIIYNEIMNNPDEKKRLIIDGYDHPEAFNGFPIDYVVIDFYDKLTGYGQEHSGYDKDGNYVVLLYVQPKLLQGQGGYSLKSALNHEMKHAWDDYNRLSKGLPSIDNTKETKELYNKDFILMLSDQNVRGPIKELLKYYYYLSKLETTAYLENVYDNNPVYEKIVREIASKDFESFKDRFDLDVNWHLMNTAYDIPFLKKFKSPKEFIDYSSEELSSKAVKMIKKINKMKYIHGKL